MDANVLLFMEILLTYHCDTQWASFSRRLVHLKAITRSEGVFVSLPTGFGGQYASRVCICLGFPPLVYSWRRCAVVTTSRGANYSYHGGSVWFLQRKGQAKTAYMFSTLCKTINLQDINFIAPHRELQYQVKLANLFLVPDINIAVRIEIPLDPFVFESGLQCFCHPYNWRAENQSGLTHISLDFVLCCYNVTLKFHYQE